MEVGEIEDQDESVREFMRTHPPEPATSTLSIAPASEKTEMSRGQQTVWIVGTLLILGLLAIYFGTRLPVGARNAECQTLLGMDNECVVNNAATRLHGYELPADELDPLASAPMADLAAVQAAVNAAHADAEAAEDDALTELDADMGELGTKRGYAPADRELELGSRQAVELNEMICRETGQNCEVAKMARRQHLERYGRF